MEQTRYRVALVQSILSHYRSALFRRLDKSEVLDISFFSDDRDQHGIAHLPRDAVRELRTAPLLEWGRIRWQRGVTRLAVSREFDALILMGDPNYLSSWTAAFLARLTGKPVFFWTHGWLRRESGLKHRVRMLFYSLATRLLIYSERGMRLGLESGYPASRMSVVYNSLDLERADDVVARIEGGSLLDDTPGSFFDDPQKPVLICTARLRDACRFDILLRAAKLLSEQGMAVNVLLVGDGPERASLEALAKELAIDVHFTGAVYDEDRLGSWLYHSDLTISPGKVGLTAIHSMMYGTPVVTHGDLDEQMPEVEAVIEGETGAFFKRNDEEDLARVIRGWLEHRKDRQAERQTCRSVVHRIWNPEHQARCFEEAIVEQLRQA